MGHVVVVGLGPARPDLLNEATRSVLERVPRRYLRTARHPSAGAVKGAVTFDAVYDTSPTLDEVYRRIVEALVDAAAQGEVLYAVPGSPLVAERSVELLRRDPRVTVEVVAAMSFLDLAWARLGVDPVAAGVRLVDGRRFASEAAGERGPMLVAQCDARHVLSEIKLAVDDGPEVQVLQRLGLPDEAVTTVAWDDLDRDVDPDHLTSLYVPALAAPVAGEVAAFAELVRTLRERCPWDREQTHDTLTRHLLEETYEVLEAIAGLDRPGGFDHLEEELGDLLFQVVFHAILAAEEGQFTLADVARGIHDKLVHRHPHVFGTVEAETPSQGPSGPLSVENVMENWERIKQAEKGRTSVMDGIAPHLPSLLYAHKVQRKAESLGLDPTADGGYDLDGGDAVGEELFRVVDAARRAGVDPEAALRAVTARFRDRFMAAEGLAASRGTELGSLDRAQVAALWQEARAAR